MTARRRPMELADRVARAVRDVGVLLREWRSDSRAVSGVWDGLQFKARADSMAHEALSERLRAIEPGTPVVSEEDPASILAPRPPRYWLIDPIDGTASYAHGFPGYVTQAALIDASRPVLAAVYAPEPDIGYRAVRGLGATANGRALPRLGAAPPGSGVLIDNTPAPTGVARAAYAMFGYTDYAECGSIALKLCRIAEGSAHLFVKDVPVRDWDIAAPHLLLHETGGSLRRLDGTPFDYSGGYEHTGLIGAADPATGAAVAEWHRSGQPSRERPRPRTG
ncbi:3'(2'),5'-bisphosphate nucleotidase [Murinocardiopsis flavida]|uniref:inositol-phosphate phosphatase n=1 Tax=Murinocardiopsis flavida TaxID=645275 RepID=A0A2P8DTV0_9ACTN|nr:inositol monophosphatase family protein [Murinocardiopsis flavida]PSL00650.1 3'(2'),5'-bisphosphate nucleotidase [Murinocardiopsis flavida]